MDGTTYQYTSSYSREQPYRRAHQKRAGWIDHHQSPRCVVNQPVISGFVTPPLSALNGRTRIQEAGRGGVFPLQVI